MRKEGDGLIIGPAPPRSLLALLPTLKPLDEDLPVVAAAPLGSLRAINAPARHRHRLGSRPPAAGQVAERIPKAGATPVCISIIVAAELRYRATKQGSQRFAEQLEGVPDALEAPTDAIYSEIRTCFEQARQPIGGNDLLVAGPARSAILSSPTMRRVGTR